MSPNTNDNQLKGINLGIDILNIVYYVGMSSIIESEASDWVLYLEKEAVSLY